MKEIRKSYKYRLYPTEEQKEFLEKCFGCRRFVYNYFLDKRIKTYEETGETLSFFDSCKKFTKLRRENEYSWLKEVSSYAMRLALKDLDNAYKKFFKEKKGFPKFRSKYGKQTYSEGQHIFVENNGLKIPKFSKSIPMNYHREHQGEIKLATITKTSTNKYFVSLSCIIKTDIPDNEISDIVGIDLGITKFLTLSNGVIYENHKYFEKYKKKLGIAQRHLSRKKKGSNRYKKQKLKVARIHEKIKNCRKNLLHNVSCELTNEYDAMIVENFDKKYMMKDKHFAGRIADVSWGNFINYLKYKAEHKGKKFIELEKYSKTNRTCNVCGTENEDLKGTEPKWTCKSCKTTHDKAMNGALNVLNKGLEIIHSS